MRAGRLREEALLQRAATVPSLTTTLLVESFPADTDQDGIFVGTGHLLALRRDAPQLATAEGILSLHLIEPTNSPLLGLASRSTPTRSSVLVQ